MMNKLLIFVSVFAFVTINAFAEITLNPATATQAEVENAIQNSNNIEDVAAFISELAQADVSYFADVLAFVTEQKPEASYAVVASLRQNTPNIAASALATVVATLEDMGGQDEMIRRLLTENEALVAQFAQQQGDIEAAAGPMARLVAPILPNIPTENPNQQSQN